jgi:hypothetical protein
MGVLATRSPYRPKSIGMSAVKLVSIKLDGAGGPELVVTGGDFLDGTPVIDIKPYVPYADALVDATTSWAHRQEPSLQVEFDASSEAYLKKNDCAGELRQLIVETLALDPRPGYERGQSSLANQQWGVQMSGVDIKWKVEGSRCIVIKLND